MTLSKWTSFSFATSSAIKIIKGLKACRISRSKIVTIPTCLEMTGWDVIGLGTVPPRLRLPASCSTSREREIRVLIFEIHVDTYTYTCDSLLRLLCILRFYLVCNYHHIDVLPVQSRYAFNIAIGIHRKTIIGRYGRIPIDGDDDQAFCGIIPVENICAPIKASHGARQHLQVLTCASEVVE